MTQNEIKESAKELELLSKDETIVVAGRTWSSMGIKRMVCLEGKTIREILIDALRYSFTDSPDKEPTDFQKSVWLDRCRCKIDGIEVPSEEWETTIPQAGSFVEFLVAPGKGGGGKNILSTVLMVAVVAASVATAGAVASAAGGWYGVAATAATGSTSFAAMNAVGMVAGSLAGMAVLTIVTYAASKI